MDEKDGPLMPMVILDANGRTVHAAISNSKGAKKSLERGEPWVIDTKSGRLLPMAELQPELGAIRVDSVVERDGTIRVWTSGEAVPTHFERLAGETPDLVNRGDHDSKDVLGKLSSLIEKRREALPEGSYTTHLFRSGPAKIRKKFGEEAVEVLLAQGRDEVISESSDLLYHWLVLIASEGISLDEVLNELQKR